MTIGLFGAFGPIAPANDGAGGSRLLEQRSFHSFDELDVHAVSLGRKLTSQLPAGAEDQQPHVSSRFDGGTDHAPGWRQASANEGGEKEAPYIETDAVSPLGVYGASKAAGEAAVRGAWSKHVVIRTAWVYGRYGNNFLKTMIGLSRTRKEIAVVADQYGNPTATIDLANAVLAVAARASAGDPVWGTYHYAGGGTATWYDFACAIMKSLSDMDADTPALRPIATSDYPTLAQRPRNSRLCCDLFAARFGIRPAQWQVRVREVVRELTMQDGWNAR
jgi:RmlD substrate binding domain